MLEYIPCERYEDFFHRKHSFKHTEQDRESKTTRKPTDYSITSLETDIEVHSKMLKSW